MARAAILALCLGAAAGARPAGAVDNAGLGPLSIRNQFPVGLAFLNYTPESPVAIPAGTVELRYQFSYTNTFVNTQSPDGGSTPTISASEVTRPGGLTISDFPATGYGLFLDMEAQRHQLRLNLGLSDSLELGLQMAWVKFSGGFLDDEIEDVERFFGRLNEDRLFIPQDRFDFFVARNGRFLAARTGSVGLTPQDPVLSLKWTLGEGGAVLPALGIKVAYKAPLESNPRDARALVSSGEADVGYYFMLSKAVANVVGHVQWGRTKLDVEPDTFAEELKHKMFGIEFRVDPRNSIIVQSVSQTSLFLSSDDPNSLDFALSQQVDVAVLGYKHRDDGFLFELGAIEDYNQQDNEADITFYFEVGWQW